MKTKNKFLITGSSFISYIFSASGEFTGWGDTILHHVADSHSVELLGFNISKHIIMLLISAFVTLCMALFATKRYRDNIHAQPKGLSHFYEIIMVTLLPTNL